jgi:hypothetical protein
MHAIKAVLDVSSLTREHADAYPDHNLEQSDQNKCEGVSLIAI